MDVLGFEERGIHVALMHLWKWIPAFAGMMALRDTALLSPAVDSGALNCTAPTSCCGPAKPVSGSSKRKPRFNVASRGSPLV